MGASRDNLSAFRARATWRTCMGRKLSRGKEITVPTHLGCTSMARQEAHLSFTLFFKEGERHATTGCATMDPERHRKPRTSSAGQAAGGWQYLRGAAESTGEQPRAACSLLPPAR